MKIFISLLFIVGVSSALAEPIDVERGRIYQDLVLQKPTNILAPQMEVSVSNWRPRENGYAAYDRQSLPQLGLRVILPATRFFQTQWNATFGLGYLGLVQKERLVLTNGIEALNERQVTVLEFPLGIEAMPDFLHFGHFSGFLALGALPTLFVTGHSLDNDGSSHAGVGAYGDLGAVFRFGGRNHDALACLLTAGYRSKLSGEVEPSGFVSRFGIRMGF